MSINFVTNGRVGKAMKYFKSHNNQAIAGYHWLCMKCNTAHIFLKRD